MFSIKSANSPAVTPGEDDYLDRGARFHPAGLAENCSGLNAPSSVQGSRSEISGEYDAQGHSVLLRVTSSVFRKSRSAIRLSRTKNRSQ